MDGKEEEQEIKEEERTGMKRTGRQEATRVTSKPWIWFKRKLSHHHECALLPRTYLFLLASLKFVCVLNRLPMDSIS